MALAAAIPLRGGMVNLGGDGQLVIGGLIGALAPLFLPVPGGFDAVAGLALAGLGGGLYAALAAWGEVRHGVPMLISSLLLSYPAIGVASYLARFPLRDVSTGLPQTMMIPPDARLHVLAERSTSAVSSSPRSPLASSSSTGGRARDTNCGCGARMRVSPDTGACGWDRKRSGQCSPAARSPGSSGRSSCSARSSGLSTMRSSRQPIPGPG